VSDLEDLRPRMIRMADAARYCGIARSKAYVTPDFPKPVRLGGPKSRPVYDVRDLDAWIDAKKAEEAREKAEAEEVARSVLGRRTA